MKVNTFCCFTVSNTGKDKKITKIITKIFKMKIKYVNIIAEKIIKNKDKILPLFSTFYFSFLFFLFLSDRQKNRRRTGSGL